MTSCGGGTHRTTLVSCPGTRQGIRTHDGTQRGTTSCGGGTCRMTSCRVPGRGREGGGPVVGCVVSHTRRRAEGHEAGKGPASSFRTHDKGDELCDIMLHPSLPEPGGEKGGRRHRVARTTMHREGVRCTMSCPRMTCRRDQQEVGPCAEGDNTQNGYQIIRIHVLT